VEVPLGRVVYSHAYVSMVYSEIQRFSGDIAQINAYVVKKKCDVEAIQKVRITQTKQAVLWTNSLSSMLWS
jgi:hypothetical protein